MIETSYTKLFSSIVTSTIWREDDKTRIVWITLLALKNRHGEVSGSIPGLAAVANVSISDCEGAVNRLLSPDKYSRSKEFEGRRIEAVDGGWRILNHAKYRNAMSEDERRAYQARWQREYRRKKSIDKSVDKSMSRLTQADTEADADKRRGNRNPLIHLQDWQLSKDFERVTRQLNAELDRKPRDLELIRSCRQELNELKAEKRRRAPAATPVATPALGGKPAPAKASVEGNGQFGGVNADEWAKHVAAAKRVVEGTGGG